jgi:hypothetical protein
MGSRSGVTQPLICTLSEHHHPTTKQHDRTFFSPSSDEIKPTVKYGIADFTGPTGTEEQPQPIGSWEQTDKEDKDMGNHVVSKRRKSSLCDNEHVK